MVSLDESKPDENTDDSGSGQSLCCPRCKSKNIEIKESKEGYFWVYLCNNCGYKGNPEDAVGCIKKDNDMISEYD